MAEVAEKWGKGGVGGWGGGGGKKSTPRRQTITDVLIITIHDN